MSSLFPLDLSLSLFTLSFSRITLSFSLFLSDACARVGRQAENESLIEVYGLGPRLGELQQLAQEADERNRAGLQPGCEELRDVWR